MKYKISINRETYEAMACDLIQAKAYAEHWSFREDSIAIRCQGELVAWRDVYGEWREPKERKRVKWGGGDLPNGMTYLRSSTSNPPI